MPTSKPIVPAQPDAASYPISALNLFVEYSRSSYLSSFGVEAPNWDKSNQIKRWFDSTAMPDGADPNQVVSYLGWDSMQRKFVVFTLTRLQASQVNLPGIKSTPPFVEAPSTAIMVGPNGPTGTVNPSTLCLLADAQQLIKEVGGTNLRLASSFTSGVFYIIWNDEPRRQWLFDWKDQIGLQCESFIRSKNAQGIGSPGQWKLDGTVPVWVPDDLRDTGETDMRPPIMVPVRSLLPNEQLQNVPAGNPSIIRLDLSGNQSTIGTGGLTINQDLTLKAIQQGVAAICNKLGV